MSDRLRNMRVSIHNSLKGIDLFLGRNIQVLFVIGLVLFIKWPLHTFLGVCVAAVIFTLLLDNI